MDNDLRDIDVLFQLLQKKYTKALTVCDPIDYAQRNRDLLYALSDFIIEYFKRLNEEESSNPSD